MPKFEILYQYKRVGRKVITAESIVFAELKTAEMRKTLYEEFVLACSRDHYLGDYTVKPLEE